MRNALIAFFRPPDELAEPRGRPAQRVRREHGITTEVQGIGQVLVGMR